MSGRPWLPLSLALLAAGCASPRPGSTARTDGAADAPAPPPGTSDGAAAGTDLAPAAMDGAPADATGRDTAVGPAMDASPTPPGPLTCPSGQMSCPSPSGAVCADPRNSSQHCGRCGRDCAMGECLFGVCQPAMIASGLMGTFYGQSPGSNDGNRIYLADHLNTDVTILNVDTGQVDPFTSDRGVRPEIVAALGPHVYWSEREGGLIRVHRKSKQGAGAVETLTSLNDTTGFLSSFAVQGNHLYWVRRSGADVVLVERMALPGGQVERILFMPATDLQDARVHATGIYWNNGYPASNVIRRTPLEGGPAVMFHAAGDNVDSLITTDERHLYWIRRATAQGDRFDVVRKPLDGSGPAVTLGSADFSPGQGIGVFRDDHLFVFGMSHGGAIAVPLTGMGPTLTFAGPDDLRRPAGAAVTDRFVYWVSTTGALWRMVR